MPYLCGDCDCDCQKSNITTQIILFNKQRTIIDKLALKPKTITISKSYGLNNKKQLDKSLIKIPLIKSNGQNDNPNQQATTNIQQLHNNQQYHTIRTPKITTDLTIKLVQKDNQHLREQLTRLKKQEKDLLTIKKQIQCKYSSQLYNLSNQSQQIKQRSNQRKQDLIKLRQLLNWKKTFIREYQSSNRKQ